LTFSGLIYDQTLVPPTRKQWLNLLSLNLSPHYLRAKDKPLFLYHFPFFNWEEYMCNLTIIQWKEIQNIFFKKTLFYNLNPYINKKAST
jgi:hypothetical protein